jgi:hypothetical protein
MITYYLLKDIKMVAFVKLQKNDIVDFGVYKDGEFTHIEDDDKFADGEPNAFNLIFDRLSGVDESEVRGRNQFNYDIIENKIKRIRKSEAERIIGKKIKL